MVLVYEQIEITSFASNARLIVREKIMKMKFWILYWLFYVVEVNSFILIPDEVRTILYNVVYPILPKIKKGTDSRIGIGFRMGPNVDFQVQFEIGPQNNTQPIGPNASTNTTSTKRQAPYPLQQSEKKVNYTAPIMKMWELNKNEVGDDFDEPSYRRDSTKDDNNFVQQLRKLYQSANKTENDA